MPNDPIDKIVELILTEARRRKGNRDGTDAVTKIAGVQIDVGERLAEIVIVMQEEEVQAIRKLRNTPA